MKRSKDTKVQELLEEIMILDDKKYDIVQELRKIVFKLHPTVKERIMYGGIMFTLKNDFGGIFVSKKHVSFEFSEGHGLNDPDKKLEGTGKYRRHLKIRSLEDIHSKKTAFFVKQIA